MPAKIRKIKAIQSSSLQTFEFNKSITPKGGTLGKINLVPTDTASTKIEVFQDLDNNGKISQRELIYEGIIITAEDEQDKLTNFSGKIKLRKQMHSCQWDTAKAETKLIPCTRDYVPTIHALKLISKDGEKYTAEGLELFGATDVMW